MNEKLIPFLEAIKSGKTVSFNYSVNGGYIESFYYCIKYSSDTGKYSIEEKIVLDRGYPDIDISFNQFEMTSSEFLHWFDKFSDNLNKIKIE